jgi:hypothetical protein
MSFCLEGFLFEGISLSPKKNTAERTKSRLHALSSKIEQADLTREKGDGEGGLN